MEIPYTALELKAALLGLNEGLIKKITIAVEEITKKTETSTKSELNKVVADSNGITLINSPNYGALITEHVETKISEMIKEVLSKVKESNEKQIWAIFALSEGLITI